MSSIFILILAAWAIAPAPVDASVPVAPFSATVKTRVARVLARPENGSVAVGLLRMGATVTVTACQPDCGAPHAWALLGANGALRLDLLLTAQAGRDPARIMPAAELLWYGRVGKAGIKIFKEPRLNGPLLTRKRLSREMAFLPEVELQQRGWFERAEGGFVRTNRVGKLTPSLFRGEARPQLPLAFVIRTFRAQGNDQASGLHRYDRISVLGSDGAHVATDRGPLPRSALRIVTLHGPPPSIPLGAKWVLIDLAQQTLTAYEGEAPVYATLISSGKGHEETQTHAGLYRVEQKMAYSDMHGEGDDPYDVDRVPYTLYFNKSEAMHGTYWHDGFGARASHGCVNLSLADALWLFNWAPPELPVNWSAIDPLSANLTSLWVLVQERTRLTSGLASSSTTGPIPKTASSAADLLSVPPVGASTSSAAPQVSGLSQRGQGSQ